jgi:hypothetical protein
MNFKARCAAVLHINSVADFLQLPDHAATAAATAAYLATTLCDNTVGPQTAQVNEWWYAEEERIMKRGRKKIPWWIGKSAPE